MKIPLNRIVAFAGPYIAVASGVIAMWLTTKVHVLGVMHGQTAVARYVEQVATFALTAILVWASQTKWLSGWIEYERSTAYLTTNVEDAEPAIASAGGEPHEPPRDTTPER